MKKLMVLALALAAAPACNKDAAKKSEPAKTTVTTAQQPAGQDQAAPRTEPGPVTPPAAGPAIPAGTYDIDPGHSALIWRARHFGAGYTYGWFRDFKGSFVVDADPAKASVELTAQVASVDSALPKRDDHLRSPDFFNAEQFPTLTFKSTKIEQAGGAWHVTGDLSLHGVTRSITADVTPVGSGVDPMNATRAGYETKLTIKRSDFGMSFMLPGVGDDIDLTLAFEGVKR